MRLIDADALFREMEKAQWYNNADRDEIAEELVLNAPTIEPERKRGRWIWLSSTYDRTPCEMRYWCSECHHETILHSNEMSYPWENFCPNCGADMRGKQDG